MKLVIMKKSKIWPDLRFAIELPNELGDIYKEDFLREHLIFYLEMALADLAYPKYISTLIEMNFDFLTKKVKAVSILDNKDE